VRKTRGACIHENVCGPIDHSPKMEVDEDTSESHGVNLRL